MKDWKIVGDGKSVAGGEMDKSDKKRHLEQTGLLFCCYGPVIFVKLGFIYFKINQLQQSGCVFPVITGKTGKNRLKCLKRASANPARMYPAFPCNRLGSA